MKSTASAIVFYDVALHEVASFLTTNLRVLSIASAQVAFAFAASLEEIHVKSSCGKVLGAAIAAATVGDTLVTGPGFYHEQVRVDKTLTIPGELGAILDGSTPLKSAWSPVEDMTNVFFATTEKRLERLLLGGKFIAEIRFDRAQASGDRYWRTLLGEATPLPRNIV